MKIFLRASIKQISSLLFIFTVSISINAQTNKMDITGVYSLTSVMETASAFELNKDSSFEFYFSQGALDRSGKGKWTVDDGFVVFNSTSIRPLKDYTLITSKRIPGNYTVIKMANKNTMILPYSDVTIKTSRGVLKLSTNSEGEARFAKKNVTEISLLFTLCPDRQSVFSVDPKYNYFEFRLESWVAEVFFSNFRLKIVEDTLSGTNPVMSGDKFRYEKEKRP